MMWYIYKSTEIIFYFSYSARFKRGTWYSVMYIWSVSRVQMQRFPNVSDTVTLQRQTLTEWVGQLYGEVLDWAENTIWRSEWDRLR